MSKLFQWVLLCSCLASAATITVNPGDSIQALIDANPGNTTFLIKAGIHRTSFKAKSNNVFIGEKGAILNGGYQWNG